MTTIAIAIVGIAITLDRKPSKKEAKIPKMMQIGLRVLTLQGAIEKNLILLSLY